MAANCKRKRKFDNEKLLVVRELAEMGRKQTVRREEIDGKIEAARR
jgi:hypothetical protein